MRSDEHVAMSERHILKTHRLIN